MESDEDEEDQESNWTQRCSSCKGVKDQTQFKPGHVTCRSCLEKKAKRKQKRKDGAEKLRAAMPETRVCSTRRRCPVEQFSGGKKTCDVCLAEAREKEKAKNDAAKDVVYAIPRYAQNVTTGEDFR